MIKKSQGNNQLICYYNRKKTNLEVFEVPAPEHVIPGGDVEDSQHDEEEMRTKVTSVTVAGLESNHHSVLPS